MEPPPGGGMSSWVILWVRVCEREREREREIDIEREGRKDTSIVLLSTCGLLIREAYEGE